MDVFGEILFYVFFCSMWIFILGTLFREFWIEPWKEKKRKKRELLHLPDDSPNKPVKPGWQSKKKGGLI